MAPKGLKERLTSGDTVIVAEGYLFEFERRGYLKAGAFVPEVVVDHPDLVRVMHEEFVHAGSDVVEAFTYYGHRSKLRLIGREDELERFNREALRIARKVADDTGTLMAGNICNSTCYDPKSEEALAETRQQFKEQIDWAVEEGADFIIGETFTMLGEAKLAVECMKKYGKGLPVVITIAPFFNEGFKDAPGLTYGQALRQLEEAGADVVGLNCFRGPDTMLPLIAEVRKECKGPIACLPVPYRTSEEDGNCFFHLKDQYTGEQSFPVNLDSWLSPRTRIEWFTKKLQELGVQYMGVCCGNRAAYTRSMAEALGRKPPSSKFSPDMSQHVTAIAEVGDLGKAIEKTIGGLK